MATRVYTLSAGIPGVTPTDWEFASQVNPVSVPGTLTKNTGSPMVSKLEATLNTGVHMRAMGRTILGPLNAATISGTVKGQMRGFESNAAANATPALAIKLVQPDGADRGILLAPTAADLIDNVANEFGTGSLRNAIFKSAAEVTPIALTSQAATQGDYLVIEWGFRASTGTARNITLSYGNDSATDLGENATDTAAFNPWWEFSSDFSLYVDPNALPTTNLTLHVNASDADRLFTTYVGSGAHTGTPVDGNEVVVWDDEQDGIADVALIGGAVGTLPTWRSTTPGMPLPCLDFDGGDALSSVNQVASVEVDASALFTTAAFTILVAFYPESITAASATVYANHVLLAEGNPYVGAFLKDESGTLKLYCYNYSGGITVVPSAGFPVVLNTPYVLMFRHEAGSIYASLNGGAESSTVSGTTLALDLRIWLGSGSGSVSPFGTPYNGRIGEVAIYNTALTGATLAAALTYFTTKWLPPTTPVLNLTAAVVGTSTTPASVLTTARRLATTVSAVSATPASAAVVLRSLTSAMTGVSVTSAAAHALPTLRVMTAAVAGTSLTPARAAVLLRGLTAALSGGSTTPASLLTTGRLLSASVGGASTTPAAGGSAGAVPTLPTTNLTLHVNASDADHLFTTYVGSGDHTGTPTDGAAVEVWDDEGDGIADVVLYSGAPAPVWRSATPVMLQPCLDFSGSNNLQSLTQTGAAAVPLSAFISPTAFTLLVAFLPESITTTGAIIYTNHQLLADQGPYMGVYLKDEDGMGTFKVYAYNYSGGVTVVPATGFPVILNTSYVLMVRHDAGTLYASLNGGPESSTVSGATLDLAARLRVGGGAESGSTPYNGRIGEVALYNVALTGAPLTQALDYFVGKWIPPLRALTAAVTGASATPASLLTTERRLVSTVGGVSTTPAAVVSMPIDRALTASPSASTQTPLVQVYGIFARLTTPAGANHGYLFPVTDTLVLPGTAHGLGTAALHIGVYDSQTPRHRLTPGPVTVHASTFDVQITLAQPHACLVVLNAGRPATGPTGNYSAAFPSTNVLTIAGGVHQLATPTLLGVIYDGSTPRTILDAGTMTVDEGTFEVVFTFAQAQSGTVVLCGYMGTGGTVNSAVALPGTAPPVSIPQATHGLDTANLVVTVYEASTPRRQVQAGQVTVHPTTHEVILTFAQAQPGTVVLNGSSQPAGIRLFTASVQGLGSTPSAASVQGRTLTASLSGSSVTPLSAVQVGRTLTATVASASATPASAVTVVRQLSATVTGSSLTPASVGTTTRQVLAQATGLSVTPAAAVTFQRAVLAQVLGTSITAAPSIVLTTLRDLTASVSGSSTTLASAVFIVRQLTAASLASSTTPTSLSPMQRLVVAQPAGISTTPAAAVVTTELRALTATISSASVTPPVAVPLQVRRLTAQIVGASLTPALVVTTQRRLTSTLLGSSVTPAALGAVQRTLVVSVSATSTTSAPTVVVSGLRALTAHLLGASRTAVSLATQQRTLVSAPLGATATPLVTVRSQRRLATGVVATSMTPPAFLGNAIFWQSQVSAASMTPALLATLTRDLRTLAQGVSTTSPAAGQQVRDLRSLLQGLSLTPPTQGRLVRRLTSQVACASLTSASAQTLARDLAAFVVGHTQTPGLLLTTARPFMALVEGTGRTPDVLLIPNSGEMACRASIVATSTTAEAHVAFLSMQRVAQVRSGRRIGHVRPQGRTATVV